MLRLDRQQNLDHLGINAARSIKLDHLHPLPYATYTFIRVYVCRAYSCAVLEVHAKNVGRQILAARNSDRRLVLPWLGTSV